MHSRASSGNVIGSNCIFVHKQKAFKMPSQTKPSTQSTHTQEDAYRLRLKGNNWYCFASSSQFCGRRQPVSRFLHIHWIHRNFNKKLRAHRTSSFFFFLRLFAYNGSSSHTICVWSFRVRACMQECWVRSNFHGSVRRILNSINHCRRSRRSSTNNHSGKKATRAPVRLSNKPSLCGSNER